MAKTVSKRKPYNDIAGYHASRKCQPEVGGHVVIIDRANGGDWIAADSRWIVVKEPEGIHVAVHTRETATHLMKATAAAKSVAEIPFDVS